MSHDEYRNHPSSLGELRVRYGRLVWSSPYPNYITVTTDEKMYAIAANKELIRKIYSQIDTITGDEILAALIPETFERNKVCGRPHTHGLDALTHLEIYRLALEAFESRQ